MEIVFLEASKKRILENIAEGVFDHEMKPEQLDSFLGCPQHVLAVCLVDEQVVGMISAVVFLHPDKLPQLWINEIGVAPKHRRHGIGSALMREMLEYARTRGCSAAWLATESENLPAQRLFESVAAVQPAMDCRVYEWSL